MHPLRLVPQRHAVAIPSGDRRVHLDGVVVLARDHIGLVDLDVGGGEGSFGIATPCLVRLDLALVGLLMRRVHRLDAADVRRRGLRRIGDAYQPCRVGGLFEGVGHHERDRLALMIDTVVLKHVQAFTDGWVGEALVGAIGEPRRIAVCQDREHAGRSFSLRRVDRSDASVRDRAPDDGGVREVRYFEFGGIGRGPGDFLSAVDTADGFSDHSGGHARAPAVSIARTMARCMSSILKSLCPCPRAPRAASAAAACSAVDLDFIARPLAEQDRLADFDIDRNKLAILVTTARANGNDLALHGLFLSGVWNDDAALGLGVFFHSTHDDAVVQRTKLHSVLSLMSCALPGPIKLRMRNSLLREPKRRSDVSLSTLALRVLARCDPCAG